MQALLTARLEFPGRDLGSRGGVYARVGGGKGRYGGQSRRGCAGCALR